MLEHDEKLLDEFKRVDIICSDMFLCQHGISRYIDEMERTSPLERHTILSWNEDYRNLKRIRWLRNQIVHDTTATDCNLCDVEWLEDFHARILTQQDPLAALRKIRQTQPKTSRPSQNRPASTQSKPLQSYSPTPSKPLENPNHLKHFRNFGFLLWTAVVIVIIAMLIIMKLQK